MQLLINKDEPTASLRRALIVLRNEDGSPATGKTISSGDVKVSKNGASEANHAGTLTELDGGRYYYEFGSGEVDTLGFLSAAFSLDGCLPFVCEVQVVAFDPYDSMRLGLSALPNAAAETTGGLLTSGTGAHQMSTSNGQMLVQYGTSNGQVKAVAGVLDVNTVQLSGDSVAADNAEWFFDGTGYAGTNNVIPTVTNVTNAVVLPVGTSSGQIDLSGGKVNLQASQSGVTIGTVTTVSDKNGYRLSPTGVDDIWDEDMTGHTTTGTAGAALDTTISSRASQSSVDDLPTVTELEARTIAAADYATADGLSAAQDAIDAIDSTVDAIKAKTDHLPDTEINYATAENVNEAVETLTMAIADLEIPTAEDNASAVRTELTPELERVDASVSSRMATFSYTVPPSAATNASAVRMELATELERIDAPISSRSTITQAQVNVECDTAIADANLATDASVAAAQASLDTLTSRVSANVALASALSTAQSGITTLLAGVNVASGGITSSSFATGAINAAALNADASTEIVTALMATDVYGATFKQVVAASGSAAVGKLTGAGTGIETLYAFNGTTVIASVEVDSETGDRDPTLYPS